MQIELKLNKDFENKLDELTKKYGEDFLYINGIHPSQLDFSEFLSKFVGSKTMADATIDPNANANHSDIRSFMTEKAKSEDKLFGLAKIYLEIKKMWGKRTADAWLEQEFSKGFYLNDSASASYFAYCFRGDTRFLTDEGIKTLKEKVGSTVKVLNRYGRWEEATVNYFGKAELRDLVVSRHGIEKHLYATGNHKWFVKQNRKKRAKLDIVETDGLEPGMLIPTNNPSRQTITVTKPSPFGIAHGFITGDGDKGKDIGALFCGDKDVLIPYFTPADITGKGDIKSMSYGIPNYFRELPSLSETRSYLYGWLIGYFAADGCIDSKGRCSLHSSKKENIDFVRDVLCILGIPVQQTRENVRYSNFTDSESAMYRVTIDSSYLSEEFFIRPTHLKKWKDTCEKSADYSENWKVVSVTNTGVVDDVYCVVAPDTNSFTLDENILTHNCWANDLTKLATEGLFFLNNYNHQPPKHLETYFDDVIEFVSFLGNRQSGAVGLPNVLIWAYYFWKKDVEDGYYLKDPDTYLRQVFQKFIYRLNQPFLRIDQCAFTNVSIFDRDYLESLFGGVIFPDGSMAIDDIEEIMKLQKTFMEVVSDVREQNMFTFPVLTYSLYYKDGRFQDEEFARWASDHNIKWSDSNFFVSDNIGILSNCCRLLSDTSKLNAFVNSIGGTALSVGSCRVSTINLVRIAYESKFSEKKYLDLLRKRVELDCKALMAMRHILKRNIEKGLLPNYQDGAVELDKQFCTIGGIGMYEVMDLFGYIQVDELGNKSYSEAGVRFATEILDTINEIKDNFEIYYDIEIDNKTVRAHALDKVLVKDPQGNERSLTVREAIESDTEYSFVKLQ